MIIVTNSPDRLVEPDFRNFAAYDNNKDSIEIISAYEVYWRIVCGGDGGLRSSQSVKEIIKQNPYVAYRYAKDVLYKRWPQAEPYIMKDAPTAYNYTKNFIKGRWPQAEPYIMKNAMCACYYAKKIINGRWPQAESHIRGSVHWAEYKMFAILRLR